MKQKKDQMIRSDQWFDTFTSLENQNAKKLLRPSKKHSLKVKAKIIEEPKEKQQKKYNEQMNWLQQF